MNHRAFMKAAHGVTLIEVVVVLAILGIVAAIAGPQIANAMRRESATAVAREVANELRRARNQAMARGEMMLVGIELADNGQIQTSATLRAPHSKGTVACDPLADPPTTCGDGEVCLDGGCWAEPARSCRDWDNTAESLHELALLDIAKEYGSQMRIAAVYPGNANKTCFSPDGRVLQLWGRQFPGTGNQLCPGEHIVVYLTKSDKTLEAADLLCNGPSVERREELGLFRVAIPYNGAISVTR